MEDVVIGVAMVIRHLYSQVVFFIPLVAQLMAIINQSLFVYCLGKCLQDT